MPVAVALEEVPADGGEWERELAWIAKLADQYALLNIKGNPLRSPKRRGGGRHPAAAA
jgi:hypothetical protein